MNSESGFKFISLQHVLCCWSSAYGGIQMWLLLLLLYVQWHYY